MNISFSLAAAEDAPAIAALCNDVSAELVRQFGKGHWGQAVSDRGVLMGISNTSKILTARLNGEIVGSLRLATKKPWAIDIKYFTPVACALYLTGMTVKPGLQHHGIGRQLIAEALKICGAWPAGAIRLDAYDADAGAGEFYRKCGFNETGKVIYKSVPLIYFERVLAE